MPAAPVADTSDAGPGTARPRGYADAPLYKNMVPVDERPLSDDEDVVVDAPAVVVRAEKSGTSATDCVSPASQGRSPAASSAIRPGARRMSKSQPLHLPLDGDKPASDAHHDSPRRGSRAVMPMFATETKRPIASPKEPRLRRPSLSCVSLNAADVASLMTTPRWQQRCDSARSGASTARRVARSANVPSLRPPNAASKATTAVFERTNFVTRQPSSPARPRDGRCFPVNLHVYDLAGGLLDKHSEQILGKYIPGMYHTGIACYGMEFYFEGGIGIAGDGRTRFGSKFTSVALGCTSKPLPVFLEWIENKEVTTHQVHDYHLTRHNCHHFCNDAAEFLLGSENLVPRYVFTTVSDLLRIKQAAAVQDVMELTTKGTQSAVARLLRTRVLERQASLDMLLHSVTACGVLVMPPTPTVLFRVEERLLCSRTLAGVEPFIEALVQKSVLKPSAMKVYTDFSKQLLLGDDTLYGHNITLLADIFVEVFLHNGLPLWGPVLNALRVAVLHKSVAAVVVFHPRLLRLLLLASRDFRRLLPDGRLGLLRVLCNLGSSPHGAVVHQDIRFSPFWVSAVGQGLMDENGMVVYTASCLANNLACSTVTMTTPSLRRTLSTAGEKHPLICLVTIILYNLHHRTQEELPEPCFNMLLLALLKIMSSSATALDRVVQHSFKLRYLDLLTRSESNESRALLCIMKTLDDLYRW